MKVISVETMKSLDAETIENGTTAETLMERAGNGVFREIEALLTSYWRHCRLYQFSVLAGKGNNGGDAYVVGRLLAERGYPVKIYAVCTPKELKGAAAFHAQKAQEKVPVEVTTTLPAEGAVSGTILVDGLLGTGVKGNLRAPYDRLIADVNASGCPVVSIDIPSGLNADTSEVRTDAIKADLTVTMAQPKSGLVTQDGLAWCGRLRRVDIGVDPELVKQAPATCEAVLADDMYKFCQRRPGLSHKNRFGQVFVVAGSKQYTGAPLLTAGGALRSGAGLVRTAVPESVRSFLCPSFAALIFDTIPDDAKGYFTESSIEAVVARAEQADTLVLGPGIGTQEETCRCVRELLGTDTTVVLDADALRILSEHPDWVKRDAPVILTPHPGEMRKLLHGFDMGTYMSAPSYDQARMLASETGAWVVLKGRGTIVASPSGHWAVNTSGNDALASAGTGDVLAGVTAGLLAQGFTPWEAISHGTFLHGMAGEISEKGARACVADDVLQSIPRAFKELTSFP